MECEVTVTEDIKPLSEGADETLLSQASQISGPEEEVNIWCDEKEIENQRRQALNDALGNLTSGRLSPVLSTLNASWDDISSTQQKHYIRKAREAVAVTLSVIIPGQEKDLWKCIQNVIPAVVRTLIPSRIIEQYTSYCREQQFELASTRSLFRMLDICSASMQSSLHGLDNITAEGTEAFDNLRAIVYTLL